MGTLAAALDVRLEKPGVYVLNPDGRAPTTPLGERALWRVGAAGVLAYGLAGVVVWS
jgi:adenosylcobinamide-phosphate synthase